MRSLCQQCFCFTCPWHVSFKETPGWTAKETVIYEGGSEIKSFLVIECPFYKSRDGSKCLWNTFYRSQGVKETLFRDPLRQQNSKIIFESVVLS